MQIDRYIYRQTICRWTNRQTIGQAVGLSFTMRYLPDPTGAKLAIIACRLSHYNTHTRTTHKQPTYTHTQHKQKHTQGRNTTHTHKHKHAHKNANTNTLTI